VYEPKIVSVFSTKGKTLAEAIQNAKIESSRSFFFSHSRVLVISQHVARQGINQIVDFYIRHNDRRETTDVVLTAGEAKEILEEANRITLFQQRCISS
jgi:spore germination protein KC